MNRFDYVRPATVPEAIAAAAEPGSAYLAAGTNLLDLMKGGVVAPERLVDITPPSGSRPDRAAPGWRRAHRRAGAQRRPRPRRRRSPAPIRRSPKRCSPAPRRSFATPRRSAATSCSAHAALLLRRRRAPATGVSRASGCDALHGENRLHAVLGWSEHCIATHPSDFCVPLVALDAIVEIEGQAGRREIALDELHLSARRHAAAGDRAGARAT